MSVTSQQHAGLADDSYSNEYKQGTYPQGKEPSFEYEGVVYKVLEHASNPRNGYQGTIYQRVDTGEIIVAHRGTETEEGLGALLKDGIVDGAMVMARVNPQTADAIALTQRALEHAEREGRKPGGRVPEVTVTGHSLGGTLAQITAHYFKLRGETFNAYGAAGLSASIGQGGDSVINHVKAGDTVSAVSPHFGQVRVYAGANEIASLHAAGYANDRNPLEPRATLVAAAALFGSHSVHHFLNVDGERKPDRSVLSDPAARHLAEAFDPMIDRFRQDCGNGRLLLTTAARGPVGNLLDAVEEVRGPLPAGTPAAREQRAAMEQAQDVQQRADYHEQRQQFFRERLPAIDPTAEPPNLLQRPDPRNRPTETIRHPLPDYLRPPSPNTPEADGLQHGRDTPSSDIRFPRNDQAQAFPADHAHYPLYAALQERLPGVAKEKLAEITQQAVQGGVTAPGQIKDVVIHNEQVWVVGRIPGDRANVSLSAASPPLQDSLQEMEAFAQRHAQQRMQVAEQQNTMSRGHAPDMDGRSLA